VMPRSLNLHQWRQVRTIGSNDRRTSVMGLRTWDALAVKDALVFFSMRTAEPPIQSTMGATDRPQRPVV